jgi:hypothetical protein
MSEEYTEAKKRGWIVINHRKFELWIDIVGVPGNEYSASITTRNGKYLEIDKPAPKASTPWEEVKKYYLIHAKNTYFRYRDKVREKNNERRRVRVYG